MSLIPPIAIVGQTNGTFIPSADTMRLLDLDFLSVMGYRDADNIPTTTVNLSNFNVFVTADVGTNYVPYYSNAVISNNLISSTTRGQYNVDFNLADNGIFNNTNPTFSNGNVSVPPSLVHYNVLKYRIPVYQDTMFSFF